MSLRDFQLRRIDKQQRSEWNSILADCSDLFIKYGVREADITEWALLETALGKTAIHFNYFNIPGDLDKAHNYLTTNVVAPIREGGQQPSRQIIAKFHNPREGLEVGCKMLTAIQGFSTGFAGSGMVRAASIGSSRLAAASTTNVAKSLTSTILKNVVDDGAGQTFAIDAAGDIIQLISNASGSSKEAVKMELNQVSPEVLAMLAAKKKEEDTKTALMLGGGAALVLLAIVLMNRKNIAG
jgi:hypothetical protein